MITWHGWGELQGHRAIGGIGRAELEHLKRRNQDYGTKYLVIRMLGLG